MRRPLILLTAAAGLATFASVAFAQMVDGEVKKLDASAGKITIKHGPIKKLGMDEGMTMVFRANDPAMLKQFKPGDKIRFKADKVNGQLTVTKIERASGVSKTGSGGQKQPTKSKADHSKH